MMQGGAATPVPLPPGVSPNDPGVQWAAKLAQQYAVPYVHLPWDQYTHYFRHYFDYYYKYYLSQFPQHGAVAAAGAQQPQQQQQMPVPHQQHQYYGAAPTAAGTGGPAGGGAPPSHYQQPEPATSRNTAPRGGVKRSREAESSYEDTRSSRASERSTSSHTNDSSAQSGKAKKKKKGFSKKADVEASGANAIPLAPARNMGKCFSNGQSGQQGEQSRDNNNRFRKKAEEAVQQVSQKLNNNNNKKPSPRKADTGRKQQASNNRGVKRNNSNNSDVHQPPGSDNPDNLKQRAKRFEKENQELRKTKSNPPSKQEQATPVFGGFNNDFVDYVEWDLTIQGTSTKIEKPYIRLTTPPAPADVRPEPVLKKALAWVKQKVDEGASYLFINNQLKSIRQDLVVQRIRNQFTVITYETHARVALENSDINEFSQCQAQLITLYDEVDAGHPREFLAYRILYCCYAKDNTNLLDIMKSLTPEERKDPLVSHALEVCHAVIQNNYHRFFRLFSSAQRMSPYLMDHIAWKMQLHGFMAMAKAYRDKPGLSLDYVASELGFDDADHCKRHLEHAGGMVIVDTDDPSGKSQLYDTKSSAGNLRFVKSLSELSANPSV